MLLPRVTIAAGILAGGALSALSQDGVLFCPDHPNQPHLSIHHGLAAQLMPTCQVSNGGLDATITVRTPTEILWNRFRVAEGGSLRIQSEDGAKWTTVHRVTNGGVSFIHGALRSTGNLALLSEEGIVVGETGTVDAPRFLASTLTDVDSQGLLDGRDATFGVTTSFGTPISIDGRVTAPEGVTLIAEDVFVKGAALAPRGNVVIGAGGRVTLRAAKASIEIDSTARKGSIVNAGTIEGAGVEMRVDGPQGPLIAAVTNTGTIRATGDVIIDAGPEPTAVITNVESSNALIEGRRVMLTGKLEGAPVNSTGTVDGSNPAGISATRQFVGTGATQATQIRPIQLSTAQRETSYTKKATAADDDPDRKKKKPIVVASSRSAAVDATKAKEKTFYRYQSFFRTRQAE
ncbi:MAG: filamentous hemagglutinin N-terminal domain-containing protein [Verrucomicrobia bacterium]|nr:filamentous hemagglutinin N-terminal domain-containing protein [Verrucomicrobiota bacterium]